MGYPPGFFQYEAGSVCLVCHATLFNGRTPKYVELELAGLVKCPDKPNPPPNGVWLLTQVQPCIWKYDCPPYHLQWTLQVDRSFVRVWDTPDFTYFYGNVLTSCIDGFNNDLTECNFRDLARDGTAKLRWGPTIGPQSGFDGWEVGDPCCICEAALFSGFTPLYAFANVLGLKKCPFGILEPPEGEFSMDQMTPCQWQGVHGNFTFVWTLTPSNSSFLIHDHVGNRHFWSQVDEVCKKFFANELFCFPLTDHAYGGGCQINWGPWPPIV